MMTLFQKASVPGAFVAETLRGISQSFGAQTDLDGTDYAWFHLLAKDVAVERINGELRIVEGRPRARGHNSSAVLLEAPEAPYAPKIAQSQANFMWMKPGFVLKIQKDHGNGAASARNPGGIAPTVRKSNPSPIRVTLICFGAPTTFLNRFETLKETVPCDNLIEDPYCLLEIVLDEMWQLMHKAGWLVADIFGGIESVRTNLPSNCCQQTDTS